MKRRHLLHQSTLVGMGAAISPALQRPVRAAATSSEKVRFAVIGLGRGSGHVAALLNNPNAEITWLCEVDDARLAKSVAMVQDKSGKAPKTTHDFRKLLEDKDLDAVAIAMPNHWQAPATILACAAGKHVYVEKPGSHNAQEAFLMVEAARKYDRKVQMGNQRRSYAKVREAMQRLHEGVIGKVTVGRSFYNAKRGEVSGKNKATGIDFDLWQGPAPLRDDVGKYVHYDWHWDWHWGGGELANNGSHALDLVRWGLGVDYPTKVTCNGARYQFDDLQQTPDTTLAAFDFGHCGALWDGSSCFPRTQEKLPFAAFYGEGGTLAISGRDEYFIYDAKGVEIETQKGDSSDAEHFQNFIAAIREGTALTSEIEEGQKSVMLCHLGNMAWRSQSTVLFDPEKKQLVSGQDAAQALWGREYRDGWQPKL